jgi:hypothetical protein
MAPLVGFTFNKIVIIQSLEPHEIETGRYLSEYVTSLIEQSERYNIPIQVISCSSAIGFLEALKELTREAESGEIPLLHVDCHGCPVDGLEFENSSTLSWKELSAALLPLNISSRFNLLAVFSACYGAYFLEQMQAIEPAPCWCLVAPTEKVDVSEVMGGFRVFYSALFSEHNMGPAITAISQCRLSHGRWLSKPAEQWFENLIIGYIKEHCNLQTARERAKVIFRERKSLGKKRLGTGALLRIIRKANREKLLSKYFDIYFITEQLPQNIKRFENVYRRVETQLNKLRNSGKYCI